MRLNDIVKGLVLGTALYAAGCGGSGERFCREYFAQCPTEVQSGVIDWCIDVCENRRRMTDPDCAFIACGVETGYCDTGIGEDDPPQILDCMRSHGWY